jgi:membrane protease YdiL (CAAX protease family)
VANSNETSNFTGIWNREENSDKINEVANKLGEEQTPLGAVNFNKKNKTWGVSSALLTFAAFLGLQVVLAIGLIVAVGPYNTMEALTNPAFLLLSSLSMYVVWIGGMYLVTKFRGQNSFKLDFKVWFKKWDVFIGLGIAAGLYGVVLLSQWLLGDVLGVDLTGSDNGATFTNLEGVWFLILGIGVASILGPISEELFFRGFILNAIIKTADNQSEKIKEQKLDEYEAPVLIKFNRLAQKFKVPLAVIVSSIVFGLMHFQGVDTFGQWYVVIVTGTLGLVFGIAAVKFKRIGPGIFAHMFYNGATLLLAVFLS